MVRVVTPCPRCRAVECRCGYAAEQRAKREAANREKSRRQRATHRPYSSAQRTLHAAMIASWVDAHGWLCSGVPEVGHRPHRVKPGQLEVDHIVPLAQGGSDSRHNLRVVCKTVNRGRR